MSGIIKDFEGLSEMVEDFLEPVKEVGDADEDIVGPVKSLVAVYKLRKRLQFKSFLKGYYRNASLASANKAKLRDQLERHLRDKNNLSTLAETLESGLASRSLESTCILGYIASKQIANPSRVDFVDEILISALPQLTDSDLQVAIMLVTRERYYSSSGKGKGTGEEEGKPYTTEYRIRDIVKENPELEFSFGTPRVTMSIEKLKREQVMDYGIGGIGSVGNSRGAFVLSPVLDRLLEYTEITRTADTIT